jgi:hypothetical protein
LVLKRVLDLPSRAYPGASALLEGAFVEATQPPRLRAAPLKDEKQLAPGTAVVVGGVVVVVEVEVDVDVEVDVTPLAKAGEMVGVRKVAPSASVATSAVEATKCSGCCFHRGYRFIFVLLITVCS